jgi:hypothetical protein
VLAGGLAAAWATGAHAQQGLSQEDYQKLLGQALDEVGRRISEPARQRIEFGLNLFIAHEAWIGTVPQEALLRAIDAFKEAGVDRVDLNPGQFPWLDSDQATIAKYDAAVATHPAARAEAGAQSAVLDRQAPGGLFAQWRQRAVTPYAELARRYQPDTFRGGPRTVDYGRAWARR